MESNTNVLITEKPKMNVAMLIMQCIGIIAVVYGHASAPAEKIFYSAFTYYSWHMPFFVFISGYFFNRTRSAGQYIWQKVKSHLIPALFLNAIFCVFAYFIKLFEVAQYVEELNFKSFLVYPFTSGYSAYINVSMWFVFVLVSIEIVACLMDRLARGKADFIYLGATLAISVFCVCITFYNNDGTRQEYLNALLRLGYLLFFFWLGACYRKYGEKHLQRFINWKSSLIIYLVQLLFLAVSGYKIGTNVRDMTMNIITAPHGWWTAIITPITATLFFLGISYSLAPYIKDSKTLEIMGRSTKYVMYYHQLIFVIFSSLFALLHTSGVYTLEGFSLKNMQNNVYYTGGNELMTYFVAAIGLILPIIACRFINKQKWFVRIAIYTVLSSLIILFFYFTGASITRFLDAQQTV